MFGNVKVGKGPNIVRGVRYQDNPDEQPQKNIFGRVLESAGNVLGGAAAQRNRMLAKKAAIREDKRAERLGFEEQIPQDEQPVFETEVRDIQQPTAFSSQAVDDTGRANLPQAMDMSRMVRNIDVSDPNQVMAFQQAFNDMGGNLKIDGKFGPNTLAALRQAQGQGANTRTQVMDTIVEDDPVVEPAPVTVENSPIVNNNVSGNRFGSRAEVASRDVEPVPFTTSLSRLFGIDENTKFGQGDRRSRRNR